MSLFDRLVTRGVLPQLVSRFVHSSETLTAAELEAQTAVTATLLSYEASPCPKVVGMVGLIGSGKSMVARALAKRIGATIIEGDAIRVELGERGGRFDLTRLIAENITLEILSRGGSVIIDSDFVSTPKRASLIAKVGGLAPVFFVQAVCDHLTMISRIGSTAYLPGSFYCTAALKRSTPRHTVTPADVKQFEFTRRTPHHCDWSSVGGGTWRPKRFDYVLGSIDTGAPISEQQADLDWLARQILTGS